MIGYPILPLASFFSNNRDIFLFVYGLIFFQLGMAIALQSRHHSRLDLARSLIWLSWFGIVHGFHEWGDIFIPNQVGYLSTPVIRLLQIAQLIMLGLSFTFLLKFGVTLIKPFGRPRWWTGLPLAIFIVWLFSVFFLLLPFIPDRETWLNTSRAAARYFIGFPAGLMAAYGLNKQARLKIAPLSEPHFVRVLSIASMALVLYSILAGLIPDPVPFFPGTMINSSSFTDQLGVPPYILRSITGLVLAVCIIRGLEIFSLEVERIIEAMEQQYILAEERKRIGRELHDGTIQKVYTAGLLVESAARLAASDRQLSPRLQRAVAVLNDAITDLRNHLGELHSSPTHVPLVESMREIAEDPRFQSLVDIQLVIDIPEGITLSPVRMEHFIAIVNGTLSNTIRHAHARKVKICLFCIQEKLDLIIQDDGIGLTQPPQPGYGLRNMHDRARLLDGKIEIHSEPEKGTTVHLAVPLHEVP